MCLDTVYLGLEKTRITDHHPLSWSKLSQTKGMDFLHIVYPRSEVFSRSFPLQRGPAGADRSKTSNPVNYIDLRQMYVLMMMIAFI